MMHEHYFSENPTSPYNLSLITVTVFGKTFQLYTAGGLFSKNRLDPGTALLLESVHIQEGWSVLDLGCGWGVVGIVLKKMFPTCSVMLTDINERAFAVSKKNAEFLGVDVQIVQSNLYKKITTQFDTIICNMPQKAGKEVCYAIIEQAPTYLKNNGLLQIVARHTKGGKTLEQKIGEVFGTVKMVAKKGGYRVYVGQKKD